MGRPIDEDDVIKIIRMLPPEDGTAPMVVQSIKQLPSAQTEIIHCRDCKHKPSGDGVNHNITFPDEVCPCQCEDYWYSWIPNDDWYCGDAERGEE